MRILILTYRRISYYWASRQFLESLIQSIYEISFKKTMIAKNNPVSLCHIGFMPKMSRLWMKLLISSRIAIMAPKAPRFATRRHEGGRQDSEAQNL
jgi:hypothetical protein